MPAADDPTATSGGDTPPPDGGSLTITGETGWSGAPIQLGARMGRYELRRVVGTGGMGVVFEAHDPELARTVAVKVLRGATGVAGSEGERRLRREGQTMARLTHGNVLRVYDVGVDHGHVFVAMEFVDGGTLADWLAREPRTPAAITAAFVEAGRGLAAAHDAGLVHRDFKPANVLVADDGRVLVTDFGLARPPAAEALTAAIATATEPAAGDDHRSNSGMTVTRDGHTVGTPAYMAPEQHGGGAVDARADQFSFCVAMWRALFGSAPFAGYTAAELATSTAAGELRPPPADTAARATPRIRAALERGLRPAPETRWPSMRELLAALEPPPPPPRLRGWMVAAAGVAVAGGLVLAFTLGRDDREAAAPVDVCAATVDRFAEVWNPAVRARVEQAFTATGDPSAAASFAEVARQLDSRAIAWEAMRRDSCERTRVRREQSDAMMDQRAACLDSRLADVAGFLAEAGRADRDVVRAAARAAPSIGDVTACGDVATLGRRAPLPAAPARRDTIAAVSAEVAAARAKVAAGRSREVTPIAADLVSRARAADYAPLLAEALAVSGRAHTLTDRHADAEKLFEEAILAAEAGGDDLLRFDCEVALIRIVGFNLERDADGTRHAQRAAALLTRLGPDPRRSAQLGDAHAALDWWHGRYADAHRRAEEAIALHRTVDPHGTELAASLHTRAIIEDDLGDGDATIKSEEEAIPIAEKAYGPRHPVVANMWNTKGNGLRRVDRHDEARAALRRSLEIQEEAYGPEAQAVAGTLQNLATIELDQHKYADAIPLLERARAIAEKVSGPDHSRTALILERLGSTLSQAGRAAEGLALLERAYKIHKTNIGVDTVPAGASAKQLGDHYLRHGDGAKARTWYQTAVRAYQTSQGAKTPMAVRSLMGLGDAELKLRNRAAAIAAYEQALAVLEPEAAERRAQLEEKLAAARATRP